MHPAAARCVHRQDGFTFDAGPTVITAPFLFEELWALCGRRLADDVDLRPVTPFYRIRFDDGEHLRLQRRRAGDARRGRAPRARGRRRLRALPARRAKRIFQVGFEELGDQPFDRWTDMARVAAGAADASRAIARCMSLACKHVSDPRLRVVLTFQSLLVGGNPFATTSVYCLIAFLERRWGVHFPIGGTGSLVRGLVSLIEGQGGALRLPAGGRADPGRRRRRATGVRLEQRRDDRRRRRRLERRLGVDLPAPAAGRAPSALDRPRGSSARAIR